MRVLFTTLARAPHLFPVVPLAWACRAAGHEVRVASTPPLTGDILGTGLPGVVLGRDVDLAATAGRKAVAALYTHSQWPADWPVRLHLLDHEQRALLETYGRNRVKAAAAMVDDLAGFAREWRPDLVVHDMASLAGTVAAAALGVPDVSHRTGSPACHPAELGALGDAPLPEYARLFDRFGVDVRATPTMALEPCAPSMRFTTSGSFVPVRYVPYNGPGVLPNWLREPRRRPRVCITWGHTMPRSVLGAAAVEPYREAVDAVRQLRVEVLVVSTAAQLDLLGEPPDGVRFAESAPLQLVLPFCDAIVHQAGDGTTMTAASLGLPQLAITRRPEPAVNGDRLAATGAGLHLRYQELLGDAARKDTVRAAVGELLSDPSYLDAARRLREEMAGQPPPAELVPALRALAGAAAGGAGQRGRIPVDLGSNAVEA